MNKLFWRIMISLIPLVIGTIVVGNAYRHYRAGEGGFKLGVDLVGGTILIYEVDLDKFEDQRLPDTWDPQELARRLKSRIDPNDLYNITVRVASNTRFEIILPTGGQHQMEAQERAWKAILDQVNEDQQLKMVEYRVPVGNKIELLASIYAQYPETQVSEIRSFIEESYKPAKDASAEDREKAWNELLAQAREKYPPKTYEVGRGQLTELAYAIAEQHPKVPFSDIMARIKPDDESARRGMSMTTEEVQEKKELIAQVGSLRFVILANRENDSEALASVEEYFRKAREGDQSILRELDEAALGGDPPPAPVPPDGEAFDTPLGRFRYRWVELGPVLRYDQGLANPRDDNGDLIENPTAENIPPRKAYAQWLAAQQARESLNLMPMLDSVVYSRKVQNPRLPEKDREKLYEYFILVRGPELGKREITGDDLASSRPGGDGSVAFRLESSAGDRFHELTSKNRGHMLAIELDGLIESAATIQSAIRTSGQITGNFTQEKIDQTVRVLRSGKLPGTLKRDPVSESTLGPTLGADTIRKGTVSIMVAFVLIMVFMVIYYRFAGMVASIALLGNLILTVAFMILIDATFTLPGLAGLVLTMGMVVDSNILIYERIREERERGAALTLAIRTGYERAFTTIIDTHLTSIFTAIVLYVVGNDQLRGFGISLTVGLTISLFTTLYVTRVIFDLGVSRGWLTRLSMMKLLSRPRINFMKYRHGIFVTTVILTILGGALFVSRLDSGGLNIDFVGGTAYSGELTEPMSITELREKLAGADLPDLSVEQIFVSAEGYTDGTRSKLFTVRTSLKGEGSVEQVAREINEHLGDSLKRVNVGGFEVRPDGREAVISFVDPKTAEPAYASRAQVSFLLSRKLEEQGLEAAARQFTLEGLGSEQEGRFAWMKLQLIQPVENTSKLEAALASTKQAFESAPQPERLENFDSQLAKETQMRALTAIIASWGAILLYLWFRFGNWTFGLAAVLCLMHDLFATLGIIALCHYLYDTWFGQALLLEDFKLDLASVASLLTLVGYSVNDTIVVFDRIRELRGKNPALTPQMINDSVNQTLSRTLLASFTTWLVVIVLYIWGGEGVHLFSFIMVIGVLVGTYSSIYVASPLLLMFREGGTASTEATRKEEIAAATAQG